MDKPLWLWAVFFTVILSLLVFDLSVLNRKDHDIGVRESLRLSAGYACMGLLFGAWLWLARGSGEGSLFITSFLVEQSLSMDNIFVISLVMHYFAVPRAYQHRVLFWGILGVLVLRGVVIGLGAGLVSRVHWVLYICAGFLAYTGVKMLFVDEDEEHDIGDTKIVKFFKKRLRVTDRLHGHDFVVRLHDKATGRMMFYITPLMLTIFVVECVDVLFAMDSIPAVLAITQDIFIVYTSNLFAIMGLRSLYFTLSAMLDRFKYLKYSLSVILVFIGLKVFVNDFISPNLFTPVVSLAITIGTLAVGAWFSLHRTKGDGEEPAKEAVAEEKTPEKRAAADG
jgi:tellurite resistance protein TerC